MATQKVPVYRKVREHIELGWADGPDEWLLVRTGEDEVTVVYDDGGYDRYEHQHGPFSITELYAALTRVGKRKEQSITGYWEQDSKNGVTFHDEGEGEDRVLLHTAANEVTVLAPCGEEHIFQLDRLKLILREAKKLSIVEV